MISFTKKIILAAPLLILLLPFTVAAAGIQVSPAKIDINLTTQSTTTQLVVFNPTTDVQLYEVSSDDFGGQISASPSSFTLQGGTRQEVTITITRQADAKTGEVLATNISVLGKPLADNKFQLNTGVKIPLIVNVETLGQTPTQNKFRVYEILAAVAVVAALAWFVAKEHSGTHAL